ncbi:diadenosine tetraphosphatase [Pseudalgibacter alginicilyticus]|uniref:Diadenosine tetraphosphatase n=1 Tax=Pseudalgibacter alginicilyticus TaxID=1736674 RepID=A0A0N7HYE9_9FLAO|nr:metallophosphoesterase family protein [Pseudalgibacter alginicilyticus]ALJ05062.1 diadenosine tetraphosphatase [Pseudalgibacter alginicilyticus]
MDKKIENIGHLSGKVLLFGGIYSNLQALESIKQIAEKEQIPAKNCICTGDIVGYCAQPEETVQFFKHWQARSIAGNVEIQLRRGAKNCGCDFKEGSRCDSFSQQWYQFAQSQLSKKSLEFINTLPEHIQFEYANKKITVVHGSFFNISQFIFKSTPWHCKQPNFEATNSNVIIGGHCGLPFHHKENDNLWINPGVIGMPANDGTPNVWYVIIDDSNNFFNFKHYTLNYNYTLTHKLMKNGFLPEAYAKTIVTGIWDNTEILPELESRLQGLSVQL